MNDRIDQPNKTFSKRAAGAARIHSHRVRPVSRFFAAVLCLPAGLSVLPGGTDMLKPADHRAEAPDAVQTPIAGSMPSDVNRIELKAEPTRAESLRTGFFGLGHALKALLTLPLLFIGQAALAVFGRTLRLALGPVFAFLAETFFLAVLLLALFAIVYKLLFPSRSLRALFTKKNLLLILGAALALTTVSRLVRLIRFFERHSVLSALAVTPAAFAALWLLYKQLFKYMAPPERTRKWIELPRL